MNINRTLTDKKLDMRLVIDSLPLYMLSVVRMDSITFFVEK
jgi:hypothetical protein